MSDSVANPLGSFLESSAVRADRAMAELRSGRPVVILGQDRRLAALALDAASEPVFSAFINEAHGNARLYVPSRRATSLGMDAPEGALIDPTGISFDHARRLAFAPKIAPLPLHEAADATARSAGELAKQALLLPTLLVADLPSASAFDACVSVDEEDVARLVASRSQDYSLLTRVVVPLRDIDKAEFLTFRGGPAQRDQVAVIVGEPDLSGTVPVRIHSACLTGDVFGSLKCDCGDQLRIGLKAIQDLGGGILIYLDQEGRGTGITSKMRAYGYQNGGMDTIEADAILGYEADERRYDAAIAILRHLGVGSINLLTNNPSKIAWLERSGITVADRTPVVGASTHQNLRYLETKVRRAGHILDIARLRADLEETD
ncbi:GTP cyclohydrolase II RibA [Consotaella salsifontis]|uniref:GTP cyclohydrolase-2 n=1 Tax=Consotaella salsifontis TaxID=1365950 RepID=A0A1T4MM62_9HYPH|nr:GTP cyclohydrolase II RibA [Consotaella salsifontis]SJZ67798.1 GTP cyclohydrolase II [Consotaella salsifontis]